MRRAFLLPCWGRRNSLSFWTNGGSEKKGGCRRRGKQFKKCFSRNLHGHGTIFAKTCLFVPNLWRFRNFQLQISRFAEEKTFHYVFLSTAEAHCSGLSVAIYYFVHTWLCQISFQIYAHHCRGWGSIWPHHPHGKNPKKKLKTTTTRASKKTLLWERNECKDFYIKKTCRA